MSLENETQTLPPGRVSKIIQVHPSLQCNLFCKHCYSSSAPHFKEGLAVERILNLLEQGRELGYNVVSLSGGEPFMYGPLEELVQASAAMGYFNSVTTNGMLLRSASSKRVLKHLNLVAVSVDGHEPEHDELRGMPGAYQKMMEGIDIVKDHVPKFGFINTVQPEGWKLFPWLAELAVEKGAALLHLHPLEIAGRASDNFSSSLFTEEAIHKIYITHYYLQSFYEDKLFVQLDLLHRDHIRDNPNFCFHAEASPGCELDTFSGIFRELIIDENGNILPIAHGCSIDFRIGNIEEAIPLTDMIDRFMNERFNDLMQVYRVTYEEIMADSKFEIFNWSELVINKTHRYHAATVV